jgi:hypothetical protein
MNYDTDIDIDSLGQMVHEEIYSAETWMDSDLAREMERNLDAYFGENYGDEQEGFSGIVTRDVLEVIEGIMPDLMKIFTSGDSAVEFDPVGPHDVDTAKIEGAYINHLFMNRGEGYKVLYDWFKDALIMKNGLIKVGWEDREEVQFREYAGLTKDEYNVLKDGESEDEVLFATEYTIVDHEKYKGTDEDLYDCRLRIERQRGKPVVTGIPMEDFLIKERSKSIKETTFCAHVMDKTIGELLEMGYDEDDIEVATTSRLSNGIEEARFQDPQEPISYGTATAKGPSTLVRFIEAYVKVFDPDDSKVKLYRVHQVGNTALDYEEVDRVPIISLSPIMMPHKFMGVAEADLVTDIQQINSQIFRQMLDNLALQNAGRYTAVEGQVNLQDLIDNRIGGIVRQKMPGSVGRLDTPDLSQFTIPVLGMLQEQKEGRTGVSKVGQGLDENALNSHQTVGAVNTVMNAAQNKILLIARNFAETGVKELFLELYNQIREMQTKPDLVPINGRYAMVSPAEWIDRYDMHVTVGIGNGNKDQQLMHLQGIQQMQGQLMQTEFGYLVTADNIFNLAKEVIQNSGYVNPTQFVSNPSQVEPPPPKPEPDLMNAQTKQMEAQTDKAFKQGSLQISAGSQGLEGEKFTWSKKTDAAELGLEATQDRPVGIGTGQTGK